MDTDRVKHMNLRTEAAAFPVEALTVTQKEAFLRIVSLIAEAVEALKPVRRRKTETEETEIDEQLPSWLDVSRSNRTVLLIGERGSGKTSVLFSLIWACVHPEDIDRAEPTGQIRLTEEEKKQLVGLRRHVVWLEPIDMDPLPGPTNLLAAILVRIEENARGAFSSGDPVSRAGGSRRAPAGILDAAPGYLDALQEFQRLQADVALAWDGNLRERGAHIDPDTYAVETLRAERARLLLNRTLRESLNALVKQRFTAFGSAGPLFVLPVDDVDLNPLRCLEILRLLRMISVPRLFFVVLGNLEMIEVALNLKYSGDFAEVIGGGALRTLSIDPDYVAGVGGKVASGVFRKLLPDSQRVRLRMMEISESLNFRPDDLGSVNLLRTHALLNRCPALLHALSKDKPEMGGKEIKSLRDFILFPTSPLKDDDKETDPRVIEECFYTARSIFRMPMRHAVDWWHALDAIESSTPGIPAGEADQKNKWRKAVDALSRYLRSAISEDESLSRKDRMRYREGLQRDPVTRGWQLLLPVTAMPQHGNLDEITVAGGEGSSSSAKIIVRRGEGWRLFPAESEMLVRADATRAFSFYEMYNEQTRLAKGTAFSPHTAVAFRIFYDLQILGPTSNVTVGRIKVQPTVGLWAYTEWSTLGEPKIALWPVPDFLSFWEYDIFLSYWNKALSVILEPLPPNDAENKKAALAQLIYAWMDAGAAVLARDTPDSVKKGERLLWGNLVKNIATLVEHVETNVQPFPMGRITQAWLIRLSIFLLPDLSGVPKEALTDLEQAQKLVTFWRKRRSDIEAYTDGVIVVICNELKTTQDEQKAEKMKKKRDEYLDAL